MQDPRCFYGMEETVMLFVIAWGLELQKVNAEEFFVSHHLNFILYMLSYREIVLQTL